MMTTTLICLCAVWRAQGFFYIEPRRHSCLWWRGWHPRQRQKKEEERGWAGEEEWEIKCVVILAESGGKTPRKTQSSAQLRSSSLCISLKIILIVHTRQTHFSGIVLLFVHINALLNNRQRYTNNWMHKPKYLEKSIWHPFKTNSVAQLSRWFQQA